MKTHAKFSTLSTPANNHQGSQTRESSSDPISSPVLVSRASSRQPSRVSSPFASAIAQLPSGSSQRRDFAAQGRPSVSDSDSDDSDHLHGLREFSKKAMPSDLRPPYRRPNDGISNSPLLPKENDPLSPDRHGISRRTSSFHQRSPSVDSTTATRTRYLYAAFFLAISLISFTVQTETAVYIQKNLGWQKAYAMLYATHSSWGLLWFFQLGILRLQKRTMPWDAFWRRHKNLLWTTAQMVQHKDIHAPQKYLHESPIPYMLKTTAFVTCALTIAGGSWYVAVDMTTASDLTAIYNCSAFFAYAFSVPLLKEKFRWGKVLAVLVAIFGVLVVAYGDATPPKHGSHSGGGTGGKEPEDKDPSNADSRALGNIIIGIGSVLYGFYEVLFKRFACPPDETSPGRSMIFAITFGSMIGTFTFCFLWIPLPILHYLGIELFVWPTGKAAWMLAISVLSNALFSGSFLILMSLTSPVLSSVAALLTIFIVAVVDQLLPPPLNNPLSAAAVIGGALIIGAFVILAYATFREMDEERQKKAIDESIDHILDSSKDLRRSMSSVNTQFNSTEPGSTDSGIPHRAGRLRAMDGADEMTPLLERDLTPTSDLEIDSEMASSPGTLRGFKGWMDKRCFNRWVRTTPPWSPERRRLRGEDVAVVSDDRW